MIGFTESISLPVCFGGAIDVFWNSAGTVHVETGPEELTLSNGPALESLAKQMPISPATIPWAVFTFIMIPFSARQAIPARP